jgi:hypothetical protein
MKKWLSLMLLLVLASGCLQSGPRCSPPYMEYGDMHYCCLDANQNNVCDKYEKGVSATENSLASTPPSTIPP